MQGSPNKPAPNSSNIVDHFANCEYIFVRLLIMKFNIITALLVENSTFRIYVIKYVIAAEILS